MDFLGLQGRQNVHFLFCGTSYSIILLFGKTPNIISYCLVDKFGYLPNLSDINASNFVKKKLQRYIPCNFLSLGPCPEGSTMINRRCFILSTTTATFTQARQACQQQYGGDLAAFDSADEYIAVVANLPTSLPT